MSNGQSYFHKINEELTINLAEVASENFKYLSLLTTTSAAFLSWSADTGNLTSLNARGRDLVARLQAAIAAAEGGANH